MSYATIPNQATGSWRMLFGSLTRLRKTAHISCDNAWDTGALFTILDIDYNLRFDAWLLTLRLVVALGHHCHKTIQGQMLCMGRCEAKGHLLITVCPAFLRVAGMTSAPKRCWWGKETSLLLAHWCGCTTVTGLVWWPLPTTPKTLFTKSTKTLQVSWKRWGMPQLPSEWIWLQTLLVDLLSSNP